MTDYYVFRECFHRRGILKKRLDARLRKWTAAVTKCKGVDFTIKTRGQHSLGTGRYAYSSW